jgi:hypothetical protein
MADAIGSQFASLEARVAAIRRYLDARSRQKRNAAPDDDNGADPDRS